MLLISLIQLLFYKGFKYIGNPPNAQGVWSNGHAASPLIVNWELGHPKDINQVGNLTIIHTHLLIHIYIYIYYLL